MSLVSEETPPGLLYVSTCSPQSVPTPQGGYSTPETTTASLSPPQRQAGGQKTGTVTGTMCAVCGEISSRETMFRKHYGVICCEACKCFFRRTVQMSRDYKCRYDGRCTIGRFPENMKQVCQACRFTQCLRAGMKIESVKKFPRKGGREGKQSGGGDSENSDGTGSDQAKFQKVLKNFSKGKKRAKSAIAGGGEEETSTNGTLFSPRPKQVKAESETDVDSDLRFSPCPTSLMSSIGLGDQSIVSSLPRGGDVVNGESGVPHSTPTPAPGGGGVKRTPQDPQTLISKKMRLESTLSQLRPLSPPLSAVLYTSLSPPPLPQSAPYTPPSFQHTSSAHYHHYPYSSHPGSVVNSPESHPPSVYNSHANTPYATPHGTPVHSPLPSPTTVGPASSSIHPPRSSVPSPLLPPLSPNLHPAQQSPLLPEPRSCLPQLVTAGSIQGPPRGPAPPPVHGVLPFIPAAGPVLY
ncbi:Steroid hormone receptor ERR1 [Geodia barretti]|uniref:Steroid hormone receptor ERR1 n=1 Tax=Geodia barretti TaxID=519541 RepID=A0AA35SR07_GEOBA|nr:Steroid hormone receptor ERR1 [Geodia barretti]